MDAAKSLHKLGAILVLVSLLLLPNMSGKAKPSEISTHPQLLATREPFAPGNPVRLNWPAAQATEANDSLYAVPGEQAHLLTLVQPVKASARLHNRQVNRTEYLARPASACTVSSVNDSGANTLRACLQNAAAGDVILFAPSVFPPADPQTITLSSELPWIEVDNLTIDASNAGVILNGSQVANDPMGLAISGVQHVTVQGMQILNFGWGIVIGAGAQNCTIGGDRAIGAGPIGQGNRIGGNSSAGIGIESVGTSGNVVMGNLIGTDLSANGTDGNDIGVLINLGASANVIGGTHTPGVCDGACNLISGNNWGVGINYTGTISNQLQGNFIGTDLTGETAVRNNVGVLLLDHASNNVIGGAHTPGVCDGSCNLISGNTEFGLVLQKAGTVGNQLLGNYIGANARGNVALPNNQGVAIGVGASDTLVGGSQAGEGNLISGNTNYGVWISWEETTGNWVLGNIIGTDISGATALPNYNGIFVSGSTSNQIGGATPGAGNLISGNRFSGVWLEYLSAPGNVIAGNKIGTNVSGTLAVPNYSGVILSTASGNTIGGTQTGAGNLISGNTYDGVHIVMTSTLNSLMGNSIGTDLTGQAAIPNPTGILIGSSSSNNTVGGSAAGSGNLVSGNSWVGIQIQRSATVGNRILGNKIGTNPTGSSPLPNGIGIVVISARDTIIGGADVTTPWVCDGPCNLVSGNSGAGVQIQGVSAGSVQPAQPASSHSVEAGRAAENQNNQVLGNFIGTNISGTLDLPNEIGVSLLLEAAGNQIGDGAPGEGNLISGNQSGAIEISDSGTTGNLVSGNRIGTAADGQLPLPNGIAGIMASDVYSNVIGTNNKIAFNETGIVITGTRSVGNTITQNSIYANRNGQIKISLLTIAPSPALMGWDGAMVTGTSCAGCRVEVFANTVVEPAGEIYLDTTTAGGNGDFTLLLDLGALGLRCIYISATATDAGGTTSQLASPLPVKGCTYLPLILND